jgi:hypothetical protein
MARHLFFMGDNAEHGIRSMRDLSTRPSPKILLVFEGTVAYCTNREKSQRLIDRGSYSKALRFWTLNELCVRRILYLFFRKDLQFEVVTFLGDGFAAAVREWLDDNDIPVHRVWASDPDRLARNISYMPDLAIVYDSDPERAGRYGLKGVHLTDINAIGGSYWNVPPE